MHSYISRRRRWYKKLTELDTEYKLPDKLLSDMLLENSGLSENQQLMVMNAIKPNITFDTIAEEMKDQHPLVHDKERGTRYEPGKGDHGGKGAGKPYRKFNGPRRWPKYTANNADYNDEEEYQDGAEQEGEQEDLEDFAYLCSSCGPDEDYEDVVDRI